MSNVTKALDVDLFERCRLCRGSGIHNCYGCQMCHGEGYAAIGMKLIEVEWLKAELAALKRDFAPGLEVTHERSR